MKLILIRFLLGGVIVSSFAVLGDLFKPKGFAGLFGAAPSVALASLALAVIYEGTHTASVESFSMLVSAIALYCYTSCISWIMMHHPHRVLWTTIGALPVWGAATFGLWYVLLK